MNNSRRETRVTRRIAALTVIAAFAVSGCNEQRPKDKYELVEFLRVEGTCFENHVRDQAKYIGELVHWRDLAAREDMRYGFVRRPIDVSEMAREFKNPNKYFPPDGIQFHGSRAMCLRWLDYRAGTRTPGAMSPRVRSQC